MFLIHMKSIAISNKNVKCLSIECYMLHDEKVKVKNSTKTLISRNGDSQGTEITLSS